MRNQLIAFGLAVGAVLGVIGMARSCGLDGVPSLLVNGRLVVVNRTPPVQGQLAAWAPFRAPESYATGRPVVLQEIRGRVLWTLPPSAFTTPWRWTFGDGTQAQGLSVRHVYRRPGAYVIGASAYLHDGKDSQWYLFDSVTVHVR